MSSKYILKKSLRFSAASLGIISAFLANHAKAQSLYFEPGAGANYGVISGSTYSWDDPNGDWTPQNENNSPATDLWVQGSFARFYATGSYTVTVNAAEQNTGLYQDGGGTVTINDAGNGTGTLDVITAIQGFICYGGLVINAPISGAGGVDPEYGGSGAQLSLFGNNTYSGGTALTSSSTLVNFNNNNSFGSGPINATMASGSFSPLISTGGSTITLGNAVVNAGTGGGINFANGANTPVVSTGNWSLGSTYNLPVRNNGNSTAPLTISGIISGSEGMVFSGANGGAINLTGLNTYTGTTTIGSSGDTAITVVLGAQNTIASSGSVIMAGGTLNLGGYIHTMTATLGLTATSTMDFTAGGSSASFANSSGLTWAGDLNLVNWNPAVDTLQVGTSASGLTSAQLADIEFNGAGLGTAGLNASGDVVQTPEPSTIVMGLMGGLSMLWQSRRRKA